MFLLFLVHISILTHLSRDGNEKEKIQELNLPDVVGSEYVASFVTVHNLIVYYSHDEDSIPSSPAAQRLQRYVPLSTANCF